MARNINYNVEVDAFVNRETQSLIIKHTIVFAIVLMVIVFFLAMMMSLKADHKIREVQQTYQDSLVVLKKELQETKAQMNSITTIHKDKYYEQKQY